MRVDCEIHPNKKKNYTKLEPVFTCPDQWYNQSMEAITTFFFMKQCQVFFFFKDKNNQRLIIQFIVNSVDNVQLSRNRSKN